MAIGIGACSCDQYDRQYAQRMSGIGWFGSDALDWAEGAVADAADAVVDLVHLIPGVDWAGEQLKDFAKTTVGKVVLTILSDNAFTGIANMGSGLATGYATMLASTTFAYPAILSNGSNTCDPNGPKNDDGSLVCVPDTDNLFTHAWAAEFLKRVEKVANTAGPGLAQAAMNALSPMVTVILENPSIQQLIADGASIQQLTAEISPYVPDKFKNGVRDYVTAKAVDAYHGVESVAHDAYDYADNSVNPPGQVHVPAMVDGKTFNDDLSLADDPAADAKAAADAAKAALDARTKQIAKSHQFTAAAVEKFQLQQGTYRAMIGPALTPGQAARAALAATPLPLTVAAARPFVVPTPVLVAGGVGVGVALAWAIVRFL